MRLLPRSARSIAASRAPRAVLRGLERLETRDCPAAPVVSVAVDSAADGMLEITGRVGDEHPEGSTVYIYGAAEGVAYPDADGNYSVQLAPTGTGPIQAQALDDDGNVSNMTTRGGGGYNYPPIVYLELAQRRGHRVLLEGWVMDDGSVSGLTVSFGGVVCGSTTTNANGTFSVVLTASSLGWVYATAMDSGGLFSDEYWRELCNTPPEILNFSVAQVSGGAWLISGTVNDEWPEGQIVMLESSYANLDGHKIIAQLDGSFALLFTAPPGFLGCTLAATVTDSWGEVSEEVFGMIP